MVIHHQDKCIGCGNCIRSCPYGAPRYNPVLKRAEKCSLCWQRLDAGLLPACVQGCPTKALKLIDLAVFEMPGTIQFPPGFPEFVKLYPSLRFKPPKAPHFVRRTDI